MIFKICVVIKTKLSVYLTGTVVMYYTYYITDKNIILLKLQYCMYIFVKVKLVSRIWIVHLIIPASTTCSNHQPIHRNSNVWIYFWLVIAHTTCLEHKNLVFFVDSPKRDGKGIIIFNNSFRNGWYINVFVLSMYPFLINKLAYWK